MKNKKTLQANKINRKIFQIRLTHNLKKCCDAELQLTLACVQQELLRRNKKGK